MFSILSILYTSYIMLAFSYTLEAFSHRKACEKHWYIAFFTIIWCLLISWFYFPCDLGSKLYEKFSGYEKKRNNSA